MWVSVMKSRSWLSSERGCRCNPDFPHIDIRRLLERENDRARSVVGVHDAALADMRLNCGAIAGIANAVANLRDRRSGLDHRDANAQRREFLAHRFGIGGDAPLARAITGMSGACSAPGGG